MLVYIVKRAAKVVCCNVGELSHETQLYVSVGLRAKMWGLAGPGTDAAARLASCTAPEALQVVARTSPGTLHNNRLWYIEFTAGHVATSFKSLTMTGELLCSDS